MGMNLDAENESDEYRETEEQIRRPPTTYSDPPERGRYSYQLLDEEILHVVIRELKEYT